MYFTTFLVVLYKKIERIESVFENIKILFLYPSPSCDIMQRLGGNYDMKIKTMTEGNISKQILWFTLPLFVGNIFQQLYNTVDSIVVGKFVGKEALAAVGASSVLVSVLVGFFMGLATGASISISQYFGSGDHKKLSEGIHTAIYLTIILGIGLTLAGLFFSPLLLTMMNTPSEVMGPAVLYLRLYFIGLIGMMIYNMGAGILRALGDSRQPFYFLVFCSVVNIIFDLVFVINFRMGVAGVAIATLLAQGMSAVLVIRALKRLDSSYTLRRENLKITPSVVRNMIRVGLPAGFQSVMTSMSDVLVQSYINPFGTASMAGWSVFLKIDTFMLLPLKSLSLAITTFVGQNLGAGKVDRVKKGTSFALRLSVGISAILSFIIYTFGYETLSIFTSDQAVIEQGLIFLKVFIPFYFIVAFNQIYGGAIRGSGDAFVQMIFMIFCYVILRQIILLIGFPYYPTLKFIAICYPILWAVCATLMSIYYHKGYWLKRFEKNK